MQRVPFGGLESRKADENVGLESALDASDCILDDDTIKARPGYLRATAAALASAAPQGIWRFRPTPASARTIAVAGGKIYNVQDPSADSASDGTASAGTTKFLAADSVSAAQLGKHLYVSSDNADGQTYPMTRVKSDFTYQDVKQLPTPAKPTYTAPAAMTLVKFSASGITKTSYGGSGTYYYSKTSGSETYYMMAETSTGGYLVTGQGVLFTLAAAGADWSGYGYLTLCISPPPYLKGGGSVVVEIGSEANAYETIGTIKDTSVGDAPTPPYVCWLDLGHITLSLLQDVKYIRLTMSGEGQFTAYGYYLTGRSPGVGTIQYRTTYYDSATGQESSPSPTLDVVVPEAAATAFPRFPIAPVLNWDNNLYVWQNMKSDPGSLQENWANGNWNSGIVTPTMQQMSGAPVLAQDIDTAVRAAGKWRLWRLTAVGWRLIPAFSSGVAEAYTTTWSTTTTTTGATDSLGDVALGQRGYKSTGTQHRCTAMAERHGRLILLYENRLWISSYVGADTESSEPYPQFPAVAVESGDGWSFDVASNSEQGIALVDGDQLYILTNERCYGMDGIEPNDPVSVIYNTGCISRRGAIYENDTMFYASHKGIHAVQGRVNAGTGPRPVTTLTGDIKRLYQTWLIPDSTLVLAYQDEKLFAFRGTRFLRFDFVTQRWTRGTIADTVKHAAMWHDPSGTVDRLWLLDADCVPQRWLTAATTDDGTALPDWTFSTGYSWFETKSRLSYALVDISVGTVTLGAYKDSGTVYRTRTVRRPSDGQPCEVPLAADVASYRWRLTLSGASTAIVRGLWIEAEPTGGKGG